jgi:hypothetical protein
MGSSRSCGGTVDWIDAHGRLLFDRLFNSSSGLDVDDRKMGNWRSAAREDPMACSRSRCNKLRHLGGRFLFGQDHLARPDLSREVRPAHPDPDPLA